MVFSGIAFETNQQTEQEFIPLEDIHEVLMCYDEIYGHSLRVAELMSILLPKLPTTQNWDPDFQNQVAVAALFHDVGKLSVPDRVLYKADRLSDTEFAMIKYHTICGAKLLSAKSQTSNNKLLDSAVYLASTHHENWDGTGYPNALHMNDIAIVSQLIAIVDSYDAIRSFRVYKPERDHKSACNRLWASSGVRYNPQLLLEVLEHDTLLTVPYL